MISVIPRIPQGRRKKEEKAQRTYRLPMQDLAPAENGTNAFLGQSPRNRSGLNSSGSGQCRAGLFGRYKESRLAIGTMRTICVDCWCDHIDECSLRNWYDYRFALAIYGSDGCVFYALLWYDSYLMNHSCQFATLRKGWIETYNRK
jgi:hypothetical protein